MYLHIVLIILFNRLVKNNNLRSISAQGFTYLNGISLYIWHINQPFFFFYARLSVSTGAKFSLSRHRTNEAKRGKAISKTWKSISRPSVAYELTATVLFFYRYICMCVSVFFLLLFLLCVLSHFTLKCCFIRSIPVTIAYALRVLLWARGGKLEEYIIPHPYLFFTIKLLGWRHTRRSCYGRSLAPSPRTR